MIFRLKCEYDYWLIRLTFSSYMVQQLQICDFFGFLFARPTLTWKFALNMSLREGIGNKFVKLYLTSVKETLILHFF